MHSTITSILGLALSLLTMAVVPIDIFLVSYMKDTNGHFKDWAKNKTDRDAITSSVLYAYYALYACELFFMFLVMPFSYFYYEEGDEETTTKSRLCSALKFTIGFIILAVVLVIVGIFVPLKEIPKVNGTEWDHFKNIFEELKGTRFEDVISFAISVLTMIGMLCLILYTGYGLSAWPMDLIKGRRSTVKELADITENRSHFEAQINAIKAKYSSGRRNMSRRDRRRLEDMEEKVEVMSRREGFLQATEKSLLYRCRMVFRPFQIVFGVFFILITLLIFLSLLLTNIDKILHSLGWRMGYTLTVRKLPNPIDITLVFAQQVYPVDYVLFGAIVMFILFCSMGGLQHIGIWFCWIRMYKIRPYRTKPQGLLIMVYLLMFVTLAMNILLYQLTPQYSMYGSQHYMAAPNATNATAPHRKLMPCSTNASSNDCVMTRIGVLLVRFFYKVWFFGAVYYWASWGFLGVILLGFAVSIIRKRRSYVEGSVDRDDIDSDDDIISA